MDCLKPSERGFELNLSHLLQDIACYFACCSGRVNVQNSVAEVDKRGERRIAHGTKPRLENNGEEGEQKENNQEEEETGKDQKDGHNSDQNTSYFRRIVLRCKFPCCLRRSLSFDQSGEGEGNLAKSDERLDSGRTDLHPSQTYETSV